MTDQTEIVILLDRSGSMSVIRDDMMGGLNAFLDKQAAQPGSVTVTLVQFDTAYEPNYTEVPVAQALHLTRETFVPRGSTALYDSLCRLIDETGTRLAAKPEHMRPGKVLFVIVTDGMENSSREFAAHQVKSRLEHQRGVYNWDFVFLGANFDAITGAGTLGIGHGKALTYGATKIGTQSMWNSVSNYTSILRSALPQNVQAASFAQEDRDVQASTT